MIAGAVPFVGTPLVVPSSKSTLSVIVDPVGCGSGNAAFG
jgi:hypothetical protein